jgi:hypothetical protein
LELLLSSAAVDGIGMAAAATKGDCYDGGLLLINEYNNNLI